MPRDNARQCNDIHFLHDVIYDLATMKGIQEPKIEQDSVRHNAAACKVSSEVPPSSLLSSSILESCVRVHGNA